MPATIINPQCWDAVLLVAWYTVKSDLQQLPTFQQSHSQVGLASNLVHAVLLLLIFLFCWLPLKTNFSQIYLGCCVQWEHRMSNNNSCEKYKLLTINCLPWGKTHKLNSNVTESKLILLTCSRDLTVCVKPWLNGFDTTSLWLECFPCSSVVVPL